MFTTRKALKKRIAELEAEVSRKKTYEKISGFINDTDLPKCESLACVNCEHIVFQKHRGYTFVLGCGKDHHCPDFQKSELSVEDRQLLREALQSQP